VASLRVQTGDRIFHPQKGRATVLDVDEGTIVARGDDGVVRTFLDSHPGVRTLPADEEGRISPAWAEIRDPDRFVPPLTGGEYRLAEFLDKALPADWRIYVRPHLDADRPLVAALHRQAGGMLWDVLDWNPDDVRIEDGLWVRQREPAGRFASPFGLLTEVRNRIYGVLVPELGEAINDSTRRFGIIHAGIFFASASTAQAMVLAERDPAALKLHAFGADAVAAGDLATVLPIVSRPAVMEEGWYDALDEAFSSEYRLPDALSAIEPTKDQLRLVAPQLGYRAIEGVAGSGKTIVLAHRAARAAAQGERVLILTFNLTLTNYVRGILKRVPLRRRTDAIAVMHFHQLCRLVHSHHLAPRPPVRNGPESLLTDMEGEPDQHALNVEWPQSALRVIRDRGVPAALQFTAVYVDEAQDFIPAWFELLNALGPKETVLAYDAAQRLYGGDALAWRREIALLLGGTSARTTPLGKAVRLPKRTVEIATHYASTWGLDTKALEPAEDGLLPPQAVLGLVPASTEAEAAAAAIAVLAAWQREPAYRARDVAVLVPTNAFGSALVRQLAELGISTNHVFPVRRTGAVMEHVHSPASAPDWKVAQAHKTAFAYGDARLKVSTVHSFKGWDAGRVVMVLPFTPPDSRTAALVYVGITRSRGDLVIVGNAGDHGLDGTVTDAPEQIHLDMGLARRFEQLLEEARPPVTRLPRPSPAQVRAAREADGDAMAIDWRGWVPLDD
jgi:hypothetical protein